jgi:hypothetical protein
MRAGVALLALLVAGCAGQVWKHPQHADQQRFGIDGMQCQQFAAATAPYRAQTAQYDFATAVLVGSRQAAFDAAYIDCMKRLGYYLERQE